MIDSCKIQCWLKANGEIFFLPDEKENYVCLFGTETYIFSKNCKAERKCSSKAMCETLNRTFQQIPNYICVCRRKSYHQLLNKLFSLT